MRSVKDHAVKPALSTHTNSAIKPISKTAPWWDFATVSEIVTIGLNSRRRRKTESPATAKPTAIEAKYPTMFVPADFAAAIAVTLGNKKQQAVMKSHIIMSVSTPLIRGGCRTNKARRKRCNAEVWSLGKGCSDGLKFCLAGPIELDGFWGSEEICTVDRKVSFPCYGVPDAKTGCSSA